MKKYHVAGYAMIPVEVGCVVEAEDQGHALKKAREVFRKSKRSLIVQGSEDYAAAFDWDPVVREAQ